MGRSHWPARRARLALFVIGLLLGALAFAACGKGQRAEKVEGCDVQAEPVQSSPAGLLATKLFRPRVRPDLVDRPRLLAICDRALTVPLTLIAAPAGFGKTTLLSSWLAELRQETRDKRQERNADRRSPVSGLSSPVSSAWLALDEHDNDPVTFLRYLVGAIQTQTPGAGADTLALARAPLPPGLVLLAPLINDLAASNETHVLVLDDYHVISAPEIHACVGYLVEHLPPQLHLVIVSREDPPLPLARMRARRQLLEVRASDLRFTLEEAEQFLREAMRLPVTTEQVAAVEAYTEGWAAGLQLAALALDGRQDVAPLIVGLADGNRYVIDYLAAEVLDQLPAHLRTFLLQTAVLERMCGPLCDALLLNAQAERGSYSQHVLAELERRHLFVVPLDGERRWYRYHHLFAAFLRARLLEGAAESQVAELHRRAGAWFAQQGFPEEAILHTLAGGAWEQASALIEGLRHTLVAQATRHHRTASAWLDALPEEVQRRRPMLCLMRSWILSWSDPAASAHWLEAAQAAAQTLEDSLARSEALGEIAATRSNIATVRGESAAAIAAAHEALRHLAPGNSAPRITMQLNLGRMAFLEGDLARAEQQFAAAAQLAHGAQRWPDWCYAAALSGYTLRAAGQLTRAEAALRQALDVPVPAGLAAQAERAGLLIGLADLLCERGEHDQARPLVAQALRQARAAALDNLSGLALLVTARVEAAAGDPTAALTPLQEISSLVSSAVAGLLAPLARAYTAQLQLCQGDLDAAYGWAGEPPGVPRLVYQSSPALALYADEHLAVAPIQVRLAYGRQRGERRLVEEALGLIDAWATDDAGRPLPWLATKLRALQALGLHALGDQAGAFAALAAALATGAASGYVRLFADEGPPMAALLRAARARGIEPGHCARLLATFPEAPVAGAEPPLQPDQLALAEPLTAREIEVLRLIATGASNQGVADALILSVGTVKKHVNNILGKLGVHSRTQALARARELGLI